MTYAPHFFPNLDLLAFFLLRLPPILFEQEIELVGFGEARQIVNTHCLGCHSKYPTDDQYKKAPKNQVFDTPEDIIKDN